MPKRKTPSSATSEEQAPHEAAGSVTAEVTEKKRFILGVQSSEKTKRVTDYISVCAESTNMYDFADFVCENILSKTRGVDDCDVISHVWHFEVKRPQEREEKERNPPSSQTMSSAKDWDDVSSYDSDYPEECSDKKWRAIVKRGFRTPPIEHEEKVREKLIGDIGLEVNGFLRFTYDYGDTSYVYMKLLAVGFEPPSLSLWSSPWASQCSSSSSSPKLDIKLVDLSSSSLSPLEESAFNMLTTDKLNAHTAGFNLKCKYVLKEDAPRLIASVHAFKKPKKLKLDTLFPLLSKEIMKKAGQRFYFGLCSMNYGPDDCVFMNITSSKCDKLLCPNPFPSIDECLSSSEKVFRDSQNMEEKGYNEAYVSRFSFPCDLSVQGDIKFRRSLKHSKTSTYGPLTLLQRFSPKERDEALLELRSKGFGFEYMFPRTYGHFTSGYFRWFSYDGNVLQVCLGRAKSDHEEPTCDVDRVVREWHYNFTSFHELMCAVEVSWVLPGDPEYTILEPTRRLPSIDNDLGPSKPYYEETPVLFKRKDAQLLFKPTQGAVADLSQLFNNGEEVGKDDKAHISTYVDHYPENPPKHRVTCMVLGHEPDFDFLERRSQTKNTKLADETQFLFTAHENGILRKFSLKESTLITSIKAFGIRLNHIVISEDNTLIYGWSSGYRLRVWSTLDLKLLRELKISSPINCLTLKSDGRRGVNIKGRRCGQNILYMGCDTKSELLIYKERENEWFRWWSKNGDSDSEDEASSYLIPVVGMVHYGGFPNACLPPILITVGHTVTAQNLTVWNFFDGEILGKLMIRLHAKQIRDIDDIALVSKRPQAYLKPDFQGLRLVLCCNQGKFLAIVNIRNVDEGENAYAHRHGYDMKVVVENYIPIELSDGCEDIGFRSRLCSYGDTILPYDIAVNNHLFYSGTELGRLHGVKFGLADIAALTEENENESNWVAGYERERRWENSDVRDNICKARSFAKVKVKFPYEKPSRVANPSGYGRIEPPQWNVGENGGGGDGEEYYEYDDPDDDTSVNRLHGEACFADFIVMSNKVIVGGYKDGSIQLFRFPKVRSTASSSSSSSSAAAAAASSSSSSSSFSSSSSWRPNQGFVPIQASCEKSFPSSYNAFDVGRFYDDERGDIDRLEKATNFGDDLSDDDDDDDY